jgi:hypothetical protein
VHGRFTAKANRRPAFTLEQAIEHPQRDVDRIVLPPATYLHEREKIQTRWPAAVRFIQERGLNEFFAPDARDIGIVLQGGMYNNVIRALQLLGLADVYGDTRIPLYVMNVTYPVVDAEIVRFCTGKKAVLMVEEGQPDFLEQNLHAVLRRAELQTKVHGKDMLPMAGEYTGALPGALRTGAGRCRALAGCRKVGPARSSPFRARSRGPGSAPAAAVVLHRLSGAADLHRHEAGGTRAGPAPRQLRHRLPSVLHPAAVRYRCHHHGLRSGLGGRVGAQQRARRQAHHQPDG